MSSTARLGLAAALAAILSISFTSSAAAICPETGCPGGGGGGITFDLTITVSGLGAVKTGVSTLCDTTSTPCTITYDDGQTVSLAAAASAGQTFTGWSGACSGSGSCSVTMDQARSVSATFADTTPPSTPAISSPSDQQIIQSTTGGAASVSFSNNGDASTASYLCRVDVSSAFGAAPCSSPWSTGSLSTGTHTVYVWAKDAVNNISSPATRTFKVVNLPDTTLGGTPVDGSLMNSGATAFTYGSPTGTSFACTLDSVSVPCSADLAVADGTHALSVRAGIAPFGDNVVYLDTSPATRSWTVDSVAPDTTLSGGPSGSTTAADATFTFSGSDPAPGTALTFVCSFDGAAPGPCAGTVDLHGLAAGTHTFSVFATDAAGNADGSPATRSWTVIVDNDGDGFFSGTDCNDADPAIHPGAGCEAAPPGGSTGGSSPQALAAKVSTAWKRLGRATGVKRLVVSGLPSGASVALSCNGKGCPFKTKTFTARNGKVDLAKALRKARLRKGATLTLTITAPDHVAQTVRFTARPPKAPLRR